MVILVLIGLAVAIVFAYKLFQDRKADQALDNELLALVARARAELSHEDSVRLKRTLDEVKQGCLQIAIGQGMNDTEGTRMLRLEEIRTVFMALEVNAMFSKPIKLG